MGAGQLQRGALTGSGADADADRPADAAAFLAVSDDLDNLIVQRVITAHGGVRVETFDKGAGHGHHPGLRFRIERA